LSMIQEIILCHYCLMHDCRMRYQATCIFFWVLRFSMVLRFQVFQGETQCCWVSVSWWHSAGTTGSWVSHSLK
jgi:hypothetical protein